MGRQGSKCSGDPDEEQTTKNKRVCVCGATVKYHAIHLSNTKNIHQSFLTIRVSIHTSGLCSRASCAIAFHSMILLFYSDGRACMNVGFPDHLQSVSAARTRICSCTSG